jgi:hypothetical protein
MNKIKIVLASALFAVVAACGGGASIEDACENVCGCIADGDAEAECVAECKSDAGDPPDACVECLADSSCSELDSCEDECE